MSDQLKLSPCPFCGGVVIDMQLPVVPGVLSRYYWARAYCQSDCGFYMFGSPEHPLTVERVNRRPIESAFRAEVERLRMLLLNLTRSMECEIDTRRCRDSSLHALNLARREMNPPQGDKEST